MSRGVQRFPASEEQWQPGRDAVAQQLTRMQSLVNAALAVAVVALAIGIIGMVVAWVAFARTKNTTTTTTTIINSTSGANWTNTETNVSVGVGAEGTVTILVSASGPHRDVTFLGTLLMLPGPAGAPPTIVSAIAQADLPYFDFNVDQVSNYPVCTISDPFSPILYTTIMYLFPTGDVLFYFLWVNNVTTAPYPTIGLIQGISGPEGLPIDPSVNCRTMVLECHLSWQTQEASEIISGASVTAADNLAKFRAKPPAMWTKYFGSGASSNNVPAVSC